MQNANQVKKRVISGSASPSSRGSASRNPASLALGEHDGIMWATNRYWLTPAVRVAPLLDQFNLDAAEPGSFEVNSTVRKLSDKGFRPGCLLGKPEDYPAVAVPVRVAGHDAHVRLSDRLPWVAAYQDADGAVIGLPADDLAWLTDITGMQLTRPQVFDLDPEDHFGEVRVMAKGGGRSAPVAIVADVMRRDPDTRQTTVRRTLIIGLLMSVKLEG